MILITSAAMFFASCGDTTEPEKKPETQQQDSSGNGNGNQGGNSESNSQKEKITFKMSGKINHDTYDKSQTAKVEFSRIPADLDEFKELQKDLGKEPHGCVALQVMAMEMFLRNQSVGKEALKLNNTSTNLNSVTERLKEHSRTGDSYAQRYIVASMLKGAKPSNGYNPTKPYTAEIRVSPTKEYQTGSSFIIGTVIYLEIYREGDDTPWRGVEVYKPQGSDYFVVVNNPAMYTQCKYIAAGQTFKGLD